MGAKTNLRVAQGTDWTLTDVDGVALCHGAGGFVANADNKRHAAMVALMELVGHRLGYRATNGRMLTVSGATAVRGHGIEYRAGEWDMSHVVADGGPEDFNPGAFCLCNLLPEVAAENRGHGESDLLVDPDAFDHAAWFTMAQSVMLDPAPFVGAPASIRARLSERGIDPDKYKYMPASKRARTAA